MPIVYDFKQLIGVERPNIVLPSVSILATPLDFRIYIGFGGKALQSRQRFLDFLQSDGDDSFSDFVITLGNDEQSRFSFFDVEWYSHITKRTPLADVQQNPQLFEQLISEAKSYYKVKIASNGIQTGDRMLCGFIFSREVAGKEGLRRVELFHHIGLMLDLYYRFLMFDLHNHTKL
jgi:hypothetical protein